MFVFGFLRLTGLVCFDRFAHPGFANNLCQLYPGRSRPHCVMGDTPHDSTIGVRFGVWWPETPFGFGGHSIIAN